MELRLRSACKAAELARRLSDVELFLLMESESFPKSGTYRAFPRHRFHAPSIVKRTEDGRRGVDRAIEGLLDKGFLAPLGDLLHATVQGNIVKHDFRTLRAALSLCGANAVEARQVAFCVRLRQEMRRICLRSHA